ncbi:hypothetical protein FIBSPDRAFT_943116 [Athelia psychrophila]|uniref:Uncharacterized protein n=1 Tax=Athelia psychrophila TaxID=1759441 RepID=A0A166WS03_9AGAM|nr:hypothetical protein FIBSPDRAFT_943116 [Fibularhizoctonia sp. CBS 109695]
MDTKPESEEVGNMNKAILNTLGTSGGMDNDANGNLGVMDHGRKHFSQALQMVTLCRAIDLSKLDSLEKRQVLASVHSSVQSALDAVIVKSGGRDVKQARLAAAVGKLIENAVLILLREHVLTLNGQLDAYDIQKTMTAARDKDERTAKRWIPIMQIYEIKKNEDSGDPIQLTIVIGMRGLTADQHHTCTASFGETHTLNTVLWYLIQRKIVKLLDNSHFYPGIKNFSNNVYIKPWAFSETLTNLEKLEDLQHQYVTSHWESQQRQPPKQKSRNRTYVIHALKDDGNHVILKSRDGEFYKNIGNVWTTKDEVTILKNVCGNLQPVLAIERGIQGSDFCLRVNGVAQRVDIRRIWKERKRGDTKDVILFRDTAQPAIVPATAANRPVSSTTRIASTVTTDRTYSIFSDISSGSSATLPSGQTTPVTPSIVNTTAAEWVEEQRTALEKQQAQRAQGIQREREEKREDEERKAREARKVQEVARKMQRVQQVAKQEEGEQKAQEMIRQVKKKQADDEQIREDQEIAEGKCKAEMLMQAILKAKAEEKARDAARMAEEEAEKPARVEQE